MITPYRSNRTGTPASDARESGLSVPRSSSNRLSLLAMTVPLLLLIGMGLVGMLRQWANRPPYPGSLPKAEIESIVRDLTGQLTTETPEVLSSALQVAYSVQHDTPFPEWSVVSRAGSENYLFRVNGKSGKVFAINHLDDLSGQGPEIRDSGSAIEAGITPLITDRKERPVSGEFDSDGKQAAESAARRYLPVLGVRLREVYQSSEHPDPSYEAQGTDSMIWTFTYYFKNGVRDRNAIKVGVDSATGRLDSFWNPTYSR